MAVILSPWLIHTGSSSPHRQGLEVMEILSDPDLGAANRGVAALDGAAELAHMVISP